MRRFGMIGSRVWRSEKFRKLGGTDPKLLYLYLHSCSHGNSAGCFHISPTLIAAETGIANVEACLADLDRVGLIYRDPAEDLVQIRAFFAFNMPASRKQLAGRAIQFEEWRCPVKCAPRPQSEAKRGGCEWISRSGRRAGFSLAGAKRPIQALARFSYFNHRPLAQSVVFCFTGLFRVPSSTANGWASVAFRKSAGGKAGEGRSAALSRMRSFRSGKRGGALRCAQLRGLQKLHRFDTKGFIGGSACPIASAFTALPRLRTCLAGAPF